MRMTWLGSAAMAMMLGACDGGSAGPGDAGADAATGRDGAPVDAADADSAVSPGAVAVRMVATTEPFAHMDGLSSLTARNVVGGVRSLELLRDAADTEPLVLFDHGEDAIAVGYDDGDSTVMAEVEPSALTPGRYRLARLVQSWTRYEIDATFHDLAGAHPGAIEALFVMGEGSRVDGVSRDAGDLDVAFAGDGVDYDATTVIPVPVWSSTAGAAAVVEAGQWTVYFPVDILIPEAPSASLELACTVNLDRAYRWTDLPALGFLPDVYDFSEISAEPVVRFGGNEFTMLLIE